jgi:hypothetical protein
MPSPGLRAELTPHFAERRGPSAKVDAYISSFHHDRVSAAFVSSSPRNEARLGLLLHLAVGPHGRFSHSYLALVGRYAPRTNSGIQISPPAGPISAMQSTLVQLLTKGHYDVKLSDDEMRRVAAWIDLNALFFGSYDRADNEKELRGGPIPMPELQ